MPDAPFPVVQGGSNERLVGTVDSKAQLLLDRGRKVLRNLERVDGDLDRCDTLGRARSTVDDVLAAPFLRVTTFLRRTARGALQGRRLP